MGKNAGAPLFTLAGTKVTGGYAGVGIRRLVELVVVFDMLAVLIGCAVSASRGVFALSRNSHLPRALSKISKRGTPSGASNAVLVVYAVVVALVWWTTSFAIPTLPEYVSMFSWMSTYGGFAIAVIYLLMAVGALKGLRGSDKQWQLYAAATVGILVTGAAIFGAIYKVAAPTKYAPYSALAILVIGLIAASVRGSSPTGSADFSGLNASEQGNLKI